MKRIRVVCGALSKDTPEGRQYLLGIRKLDSAWGGAAEFPGGKMEPGESEHETLRREWDEELRLQPTPAADPVATLIFDRQAVARPFDITMYRVEASDPPIGVPMPAHEHLYWATLDEVLATKKVTPSTHAFAAFLKSLDRLVAGEIHP